MNKVLLLNTSFFPKIGGVENSLLHLAKEFNEKGWLVEIFTPTTNDEFIRNEKVRELGIKCQFVEYTYSEYPLYYLKIWNKLKMIEFEKYDLVISRSYIISFVLSMMKIDNIYVVPGLIQFHKSNYCKNFLNRFKNFLDSKVEKIALENSKLYVFSELMKNDINETIKNANISICKPGVDPNLFHANFNKIRNDTIELLVVARVEKVKGIQHVIEMMPFLDSKVKLTIIGDGAYKTTLEELATTLSVDVDFLGKVNNAHDFYSRFDYFFMCSEYEPFGQTILESIASGLPVIAFEDTKENRIRTATCEIFKDHSSLVNYIKLNDYKSAASELDTLLVLDEKISKEDVDKFLSRYTWKSMVNEIITNEKNSHSITSTPE